MSNNTRRLLHVDDDPYLQEYIITILADIAVVSGALSLTEARTQLQKQSYDLVLLDLTLPDGSGFELIRELSDSHPDTPIIIFSDHEVVTPPGKIAGVFQKSHFSEASLTATITKLLS